MRVTRLTKTLTQIQRVGERDTPRHKVTHISTRHEKEKDFKDCELDTVNI
jgi:hypothetical protein